MTQDELLKTYDELNDRLEAAPDSPVPFPVVKDEKMSVVGDANETEINKRDFVIEFRFPEGIANGEKVAGGVLKRVEYKNVFITPRRSGKVVASLCRLLPFFRKLAEDGEHSFTREEVEEILALYGDEFIDNMYDLVAKVLQIDENLVDYMTQKSVINASVKIFTDYPEVLNEAEAFF